MDNITENVTHSQTQHGETTPPKPRITFMNRYLHISAPHNRVNRGTFFLNMFLFGIGLAFLDKIPYIEILFAVLGIVQITKRFHDFGKSGKWTIGVIGYHIIVSIAPIIYFMIFTDASYLDSLLNWKISLILHFHYMLLYTFILILPIIVLCLIPGDKTANAYGDPQNG